MLGNLDADSVLNCESIDKDVVIRTSFDEKQVQSTSDERIRRRERVDIDDDIDIDSDNNELYL